MRSQEGLPVDEDLFAFALELYRTQGRRCALSGLPFDLRVVGSEGGDLRRPWIAWIQGAAIREIMSGWSARRSISP